MKSEELRAMASRWMTVWQGGDTSPINEMHDDDFFDHSPAGRSVGNEGFKRGVNELYEAFPDFHASVDDTLVDAEKGEIAIRWSATGTHLGEFMSLPPTTRRVLFRGIEIIKIENGKITDRWGEWDGIELMRQLGFFQE